MQPTTDNNSGSRAFVDAKWQLTWRRTQARQLGDELAQAQELLINCQLLLMLQAGATTLMVAEALAAS